MANPPHTAGSGPDAPRTAWLSALETLLTQLQAALREEQARLLAGPEAAYPLPSPTLQALTQQCEALWAAPPAALGGPADGDPHWARVRQLAQATREENALNGRIIQERLAHAAAALAALGAEEPAAALYTAAGQPSPRSRRPGRRLSCA